MTVGSWENKQDMSFGFLSGVGEGVTEVKHESKAVEKVIVKLVKRKSVEGYC